MFKVQQNVMVTLPKNLLQYKIKTMLRGNTETYQFVLNLHLFQPLLSFQDYRLVLEVLSLLPNPLVQVVLQVLGVREIPQHLRDLGALLVLLDLVDPVKVYHQVENVQR